MAAGKLIVVQPMTAGTKRASHCAGVGDLLRVPMAKHLRATRRTFSALRLIAGVTIFAFGVLAGAGIAAWLMPPS
jgi:hypothetical protein